MLFHTPEFLIFLILIFFLYHILSLRFQNLLLLVASYFFYGYWRYEYLSLIIISTLIDFYCGKKISECKKGSDKKAYLVFSLITNLGILAYFKYFNFFASNVNVLLERMNSPYLISMTNVLLPIGISFYTFQSMSYTIDVYREQLKPEPSFIRFALYISYFPQLIAGPIERASHFIPQLYTRSKFSFKHFQEGFWLFCFGLFQKMVIADNLAILSDWVFEQNIKHNGFWVLSAIYAFSFQILADFSGYSNMARGISKFFGINLNINFRSPYLSTNPSEFWKRWHVTLSCWLRDYLYIPLGGSKKGKKTLLKALILTMVLGGLWHGASWNFIFWGLYHGILLVLFHSFKETAFVKKVGLILPKWFKILFFFHVVSFGWIFFRSKSIAQSYELIKLTIFNFNFDPEIIFPYYLIMALYWVWQFFQYKQDDYSTMVISNKIIKVILYLFLFFTFIHIGEFDRQEFIYFQF